MHLRLLRTILLYLCLIGLFLLSGVWVVRATSSTKHSGRNFQASGHGIVYPQVINTASLPHIQNAESGNLNTHSTTLDTQTPVFPSQKLSAPSNVVNVPVATTTDSHAKPGISSQGGKPDANGTGGVDNYLETVNGEVAIYSRGGTSQLTSSFSSWFHNSSNYYDPVTTWDNTGSRFIFSVLQTSAKKIWVSVAQQKNARGKYCNYSFPTPSGHDFDKLGVDSDGIYFGFNILAAGSSTNVVSNQLFFASRTLLESCQTATYTEWTGLTNPDGSIAQAITPARQDSDAGGVEYLINSYPAGACQLTLWTLTSSANLSNTSVPTQCYSSPTNAKQKGSSALISTGDCSITQASFVNGLLTLDMPGAYDWGDGNGTVSIVQWYVINPSSASVSNQGAFGTPGYWLFYPSAITTSNGNMLFMYNVSGASIYPSVWYVNQTLTGTTALVNGTGPFGTTGVSPWGDYQSAWPDTNAGFPNLVWITGEYAQSTNLWGSKFDLVTP